jgi:hypothetical protein
MLQLMTESGNCQIPCRSISTAKEEALNLEAVGEVSGYGKIISFFIDDRKSDRGRIR